MDIFLDIGFTLLGGPQLSPPKKLMQIFNLEQNVLESLSDLVFTQKHVNPISLINSIENLIKKKASKGQIDQVVAFWNQQHEDCFEIKWASEFLESLLEVKTDINIVSNLWFPFYERFKQVFRTNIEFFKSETLSFNEGIRKPNPRFYDIALSKASASPSKSISIGDSFDNDIRPFSQLGMNCIWFISRPSKSVISRLFKEYPRVFKVSDLKEALNKVMLFVENKRRSDNYENS